MFKAWLKPLMLLGVLGLAVYFAYTRYFPGQAGLAVSAPTEARAANPVVETLPVAVRRTAANRSGIVKCVGNGRTTYTNDECPAGTRQVDVKLRDNTLGFVLPSAPKPAAQASGPALKEAMMERLIEKGSTHPDR